MKLGINMLLWAGNLDDSHLPLFPKLKSMGYDGVEVPVCKFDMDFYKRLANELKNNALDCTISMALPAKGASFISDCDCERKAALDFMNRLFDVADVIGAKMIMGPFFQPLGVFSGCAPTEKEKARCLEGHAILAKNAQARGITLTLEVLNRFECYMFNTIAQGAEHVAKIGNENLKLAFDTFHANVEEKDPLAVAEKYFKHIAHVHVSENDRGIAGSGHAAIAPVIGKLVSLGYDDWFTLEMFGSPLPEMAAATCCWRPFFDDMLDACAQSAKFLRAAMNEAISNKGK